MADHPFPAGARVRHDGRRWSRAPFATVLEAVEQHDGTYEYRVAVDADSSWPTAGEETWWASYHTRLGDGDEDGGTIVAGPRRGQRVRVWYDEKGQVRRSGYVDGA